MKIKHSLFDVCMLSIGLLLIGQHHNNAQGQVLFLDNFEQFGSGTDLTSTNYTPVTGPSSASVITSVQNGSPIIEVTNFLGSTWALFNNSVVTNKNAYKGLLSSVQTNQPLQVTWKMWLQATNSGPGMFLFSVPVQDPNPGVTFNPPLAFMDSGAIVALTNGTSVLTVIGNWSLLAGTVMTNTLILDYPNRTFTYSLNGQTLATLPLGLYFTNVVGAIYFNGFERSVGSLGNRFAIDDVKVDLAVSTQTNTFQWANRIASTSNTDFEIAIGMTLDPQGNVYVTGWFDGVNDFGGVTLTSKSAGGQDIFVAKYDPSGALQWAHRAGGNTANWNAGRGIGVDNAGNVYVTGQFFGVADFGNLTLTGSPFSESSFLAKYDSAGTVQWVRQSVGGVSVYGTGLAVDGAGNSYAVGYADGATITFGTTNLLNPSTTGYSTFLVKYDNAGTLQWAQLMGGPGQTYAAKVAVDAAGNVYVHGAFSKNMTIGTSNLVSAVAARSMFVAKFDGSGALTWVQQFSGAAVGEGGVAVDQAGSVYVTGQFAGGGSINFGSISLTGVGSSDAYVAKYNSSGAIQWARRAAGAGADFDFYWDAALDGQGNVYVGGVLGSDMVAAKYDPAGTLQWTYSASGPPASPVSSIAAKVAVDSAGNAFLAGWYRTPTTFGTNVLQTQGYWNYFLTRLGSGLLVSTNPPVITSQHQSQTVNAGQNASFTVTATGTIPLRYQWRKNGGALVGQTGASLNLNNVSPADAGNYDVVVSNGAGNVISAVATLLISTELNEHLL